MNTRHSERVRNTSHDVTQLPNYTVLVGWIMWRPISSITLRFIISHLTSCTSHALVHCSTKLSYAYCVGGGDTNPLYSSGDVCYTLPPDAVLLYARLASTPPSTNMSDICPHSCTSNALVQCSTKLSYAYCVGGWDIHTIYTSGDVCYTLPPGAVLLYARLASIRPSTNMRRYLSSLPARRML